MKLPTKSQYPKSIPIPCKNGEIQHYQVKWVRRFKDPKLLAECDPGDYVITIKLGQTRAETFKCLIHEILHAISFEWPMKIRHDTIYALEEALFQLLNLNI